MYLNFNLEAIIKKRKISLIGEEELITEFKNKYEREINIGNCILIEKAKNYKNNIVWIENIDDVLKDNDFIIICTSSTNIYDCIANTLGESGYKHYTDYISYVTVERMVFNKKIMLCVGECQVGQVASYLEKMQNTYKVVFLDIRFISGKAKPLLYAEYSKICDVFIYNEFHKYEKVLFGRDELLQKPHFISLPVFEFFGIWPQIGKSLTKKNKYNLFELDNKGPFPIADNNINKFIEEGKSCEEVKDYILNKDIYTKDEVILNYEKSIRLLELTSKKADISLSDYVINTIRNKKVFRDNSHIYCDFYYEICERIIEQVGIKVEKSISINDINVKDTCTEIIVYPCVAKHLNLSWWGEELQYEVRCKIGEKNMLVSADKWIEIYYDYCMSVKKIRDVFKYKMIESR